MTKVEAQRSPSLVQIAWHIWHKGALQFFMDEWHAQGDLPKLRMGRHKLLFVFTPTMCGRTPSALHLDGTKVVIPSPISLSGAVRVFASAITSPCSKHTSSPLCSLDASLHVSSPGTSPESRWAAP